MLVDGAIVVTEFADRRMQEGTPRKEAYRPKIANLGTTPQAARPVRCWSMFLGHSIRSNSLR